MNCTEIKFFKNGAGHPNSVLTSLAPDKALPGWEYRGRGVYQLEQVEAICMSFPFAEKILSECGFCDQCALLHDRFRIGGPCRCGGRVIDAAGCPPLLALWEDRSAIVVDTEGVLRWFEEHERSRNSRLALERLVTYG